MKVIYHFLSVVLVAATLFSCKEKNEEPAPDTNEPIEKPIDPLVKPHGTAIGAAVGKSIGAEGGSVAMADNSMKIIVPPGAVDESINFSIQEVSSTVGKFGIGNRSFRLLPENVQFKKDIELSIAYQDTSLNGTTREVLRLAYQDKKGRWHITKDATVNEQARTITVKTKHFSDWTLTAAFKIVPKGQVEFLAKETGEFEVIAIQPPGEGTDDDLLAPVFSAKVADWETWALAGTLVEGSDKATFKANDFIENFVGSSVTARFNYSDYTSYFKGRNTGRFYVDYDILAMPDEYFIWGENGYTAWSSYNSLEAKLSKANKFRLTGRSFGHFLIINTDNINVGKYSFDSENKNFVNSSQRYTLASSYRNCDQIPEHTLGAVFITKNENGYIEGVLQGELRNMTSSTCSQNIINATTGKFRIKKPVPTD